MKRFLLLTLALFILIPAEAKTDKYPLMFAHRGCWSKNDKGEFVIPENSVAAVAAAKKMGYKGIECDVHYTKDKRMVILHDATLNRTARNAKDYSKIEKPIKLSDLTFEELRRDYVLESADPTMRTPIPTLEELLAECKKQGIVPMLHSDLMESYHVAQKMFGDEWICFTGGVAHMQKVREFSNCTILLAINAGTTEQIITNLKKIGGHCGISTMKYQLYTPEFCKALTDAGYEVQASIFPRHETVKAQKSGITYQLTDYSFMPPKGKKHIKKIKLSDISFGNTGQDEIAICRDFNHTCKYGAVVIDIEFEGDIKLVINHKIKINLSSDGRPIEYCIGQRLIECMNPTIEIFSTNGKAQLIKMQARLYDMSK